MRGRQGRGLAILSLIVLCGSLAEEEESDSMEDLSGAMVYLLKYGYVNSGEEKAVMSSSLVTNKGLRAYIEEFQAFANLSLTGKLDKETVEMMKRARCGVRDLMENRSHREKRYALQGSRWKTRDLSYKISKYPTAGTLSKLQVDQEISKALQVWANVTNLTFKQKTKGKVHIDISFERRSHGDGDPFDGPGGTLAHAFFPVYGGDVHLDDSELWTVNSYTGTNLLQTAAHEFGHSLGLHHSDQFRALMSPFYRGYDPTGVKLDKDDISAIQALYGKTKEKKPVLSSSSNVTEDEGVDTRVEELCTNATIDSILTTKDGSTYVFRGDNYWKLTSDSTAPGYPKSVSKFWSGLPASLDAAFTWTNGKSYFFQGRKYWRFSNGAMDRDYPRPIRRGFDGIPDKLDAAFVWSGNGKIYFFKGTKYWRFDPQRRPPVKRGYPKPISNWEGIPNHIDDAIQYTNGYTYFFKKGFYYRFDDTKFRVDTKAQPPFPRPAQTWWFGCTSEPRQGSPEELTANLMVDPDDAEEMLEEEDEYDLENSNEVFDPESFEF